MFAFSLLLLFSTLHHVALKTHILRSHEYAYYHETLFVILSFVIGYNSSLPRTIDTIMKVAQAQAKMPEEKPELESSPPSSPDISTLSIHEDQAPIVDQINGR